MRISAFWGTSPCSLLTVNLKMEAMHSFEVSVDLTALYPRRQNSSLGITLAVKTQAGLVQFCEYEVCSCRLYVEVRWELDEHDRTRRLG